MDPSQAGEKNFRGLVASSEVDFGRQSEDYAKHRPGFPDSFYHRIVKMAKPLGVADKSGAESKAAAAAAAAASLDVLDIGTGPGIVALRLAQLYASVNVTGVDIAANQIEAAKKRAKEMGVAVEKRTRFAVATAEDTKQADASFDLVIAGQCWPWFDQTLAMAEARRVLRPGGLLVVAQFCYLPRRSKIAHDTEQLILKFNPKWGMANGNGLYPGQVDDLVVRGGFAFSEQFSYDSATWFTEESWRGRIRTCNGVGSSSLTAAEIEKFDKALSSHLVEKGLGQATGKKFNIWHRVWAVVVRNEKEQVDEVEEQPSKGKL